MLRSWSRGCQATAMTSITPLLHEVEYAEASAPTSLRCRLRVASYNIERGLRLESIVDQWKQHCAGLNDVILLSEADRGMARSGNRHVARDFAAALDYSWAYAVEFLELTKGNRRERRVAGENEVGHIGNAILSRYPLANFQVIRLPCFFDYSKRFMARIGSRMAVVADLLVDGRALTVASVHMESDSSPEERSDQMEALLRAIRNRDGGQPIIIGGDMNTTGLDVNRLIRSVLRRPWIVAKNPAIDVLEQIEPMFSMLRREGYDYRHCNLDRHTLQVRGFKAHLDWFFVKNVEPKHIRNPAIYDAFQNRYRFSDHLPIAIELALDDACL